MFKSFLLELNISAVKTNYIFAVNSNDLNVIRLDLVIKDNAELVDLTGKIVRLAIRKPDQTVVFQSGGVTDGPGGKCEFILSKQAALVPGRHEGEVMIYEGDSTVAVTTKFYYEVKRAVLSNSDVESSSDFPAISQAIQAGEILKEIDIHSVIEAGAIAGGVQEEMNLAKQKEDGTLFGTVQERLNDTDDKIGTVQERLDNNEEQIGSNATKLIDTFKDLEQRSINVKLPPFNAKGDGVNDTQAIQAALTYASQNTNKKLYFPSGTYYSTLPVSVFDNLTIEGAGVSTVLKFSAGINGIVGTGTFKNITLKNLKLQGANAANANENGINFVGDSGGFPKLIIQNLQISDFGNNGMYLENCWDGSVENVNVSGNKNHGAHFVNCFSMDMKKIVAYSNKGRGVYIQSSAGSLFTGTSQENEKEGVLVESSKGCTFEMYLEQNGWNTTTDNEKSQFRVTQRAGGYKPSSGNTFNLYVLGGKGSALPTMESKYGIYIDYGLQNIINGNFGGHLTSDIYLTSNSSNNKLNAVEYETGQSGGDTPTPLTNNGTMNGYTLMSTNKNSRIESLSYASQATVRSITFTKPFITAPKIVGTVVGSTSTVDMTVKIANVTISGFDFVVTDGAAYVNAVQVNFIAIGE